MYTVLKLRKILPIFIIILVQSILAVSAGFAAIYLVTGDTLPPNIVVGGMEVGGLTKAEAAVRIEEYFKNGLINENLKISFDGKEYDIPYADFDIYADGEAAINFMSGWKAAVYLPNLIKTYFGREKLYVRPVFVFNEGKLRQKLIELSQQLNAAPIDASVSLKEGKIVKKAETPGYTLNVKNAVEAIRKHLAEDIGSPVAFSGHDNYEIQAVNAKVTLKDFEDIEQVLSQYTTEIADDALLSSIELAARSINGNVLTGSDTGNDETGTFSLVENLKKADESFENDNEGYDQVASTLYAALLTAGIDKNAITRLPHKLSAEYIEPGLDAWISGSGGDLKFRNNFKHKIALFAEVQEGKVTVSLAGSLQDKKQAYDLKVETIQKIIPPVVNIENRDLKPGEKVMLSPGKEGLVVEVYRNAELISTERYEAEKAMVQIGPGTAWNNGMDK